MSVSSGFADQVLVTYFREKMNDLGPPPFSYNTLQELKDYWESTSPGWFNSYKSAIDVSGLTITQANEAMKNAAVQYGTPSTPKILFDELYAKSNDTRFQRAWTDLLSSAAKKTVVISQKTQDTVENAAEAASVVASYGPYIYACVGIAGFFILLNRFKPEKILSALKGRK